ncbi:MAG: MATE family efflux transporter [Pseudomonadota bacterium]
MRHVVVMSSTTSVGLVAVFFVDLVDMFFISLLGNQALAAAVGFAGAISFFMMSFSIAMGIATGALVARALGQGQPERAQEVRTHVFTVGIIVMAIVSALTWFNLETLTGLVGAKGETQDLAVRYLAIIVPSLPLMMIGMGGGAILRAHGDANRSMVATLSAAGANAVLDPIFIFALGLGLDGAAIATVLSRIVLAFMGVWPVIKHHGGFAPLKWGAFKSDLKAISDIAFPATLTNLATPVGSAFVTRVAAEFSEQAVAGMAIIGRLTPVAFGMILALSGAIGPILGQNYGAKLYDRVRKAFNEAVLFTGLYTIVVVAILWLCRGFIADAFGAEGEARDLVYLFCGPLSLAWFFNGVIFIGNASYNNLGHPFYSTWINWGRHTLGTIPFVWLGAAWFGAEGVLAGQMIGGVFVAAISWWLAYRMFDRIALEGVPDLKGPAFGQETKAMRLFHMRKGG